MRFQSLVLFPLFASSLLARPIRFAFSARDLIHDHDHDHTDAPTKRSSMPVIDIAKRSSHELKSSKNNFVASTSLTTLLDGNKRFVANVKASPEPDILRKLADEGQKPEFMFIGCRYVALLLCQQA
jgi:hypothetical protein